MKKLYFCAGVLFLLSFFWMILVVNHLFNMQYQFDPPVLMYFLCFMQLVLATVFFYISINKKNKEE
ncbi:hypothetical protein [Isobaculum melis]|uniref:Uncharacterized protein n=1 Tax=Isobaculum melis TaxID=142588 RepID=A0A1H9SCX0_9LACT|nr:hypothetical protein [Isobaculum melis]SER82844.1 hypothetical protein SAMN04488559_10737 [Isobaculum melis]